MYIMDLGQVFTTKKIAEYMVSLFSNRVKRVLDPCFGNGAFIEACRMKTGLQVEGCEIDAALYKRASGRFLDISLYQEDFLQFKPERYYDGIVMNPPYIRHEKIDDLASLGITKRKLRRKALFSALPPTANMYMYFIAKAFSLLKDEGELIVIFPGDWAKARRGAAFRNLIDEMGIIERKIHLSGDIFEANVLVGVDILKIVKSKSMELCCEEEQLLFKDGRLRKKPVAVARKSVRLPMRFEQYATVCRGVTTGWNRMFINPEINRVDGQEYLQAIVSSPKDIIGFNTDKARTDDLLVVSAVPEHNDIITHYIERYRRSLSREKKPAALYRRMKQEENWYEVTPIDSRGILFGYIIREDMRFILNTKHYLARDNFYIIRPKCNEYVMMALLNNLYTFYQLEMAGKQYGTGILKLQSYDIRNLTLFDVRQFTGTDRVKIKYLGQRLVETSNKWYISEITKVLSQYAEVGYDEIVSYCQEAIQFRLTNQ